MSSEGSTVAFTNNGLRGSFAKAYRSLVVIALFVWGMWSLPVALLGPELEKIPGDLGDARFGNYILEHFHRYSTGLEPSFWRAPFLYPRTDRSVQMERLAGSAPFYALFRRVGWRPESAFQLWMVTMFLLNFWSAWWALRQFGAASVPSACGAFIQAFGIHQIDLLGHPEIYARFAIPLAFLGLWRVLQGGGLRWWMLAIGATVLQFWCSVGLGYFLVYGLFALSMAHLLVFRSMPWRTRLRNRRTLFGALVVLGLGVLLLLPLHTAHGAGTSASAQLTTHRVPELRSHFITHPAALSWQSLRWTGGDELTEWWYHQHFMGAVAWVGVLLAIVLLIRYRAACDARLLFTLLLALSLSLLLCLRIGEVCTFLPIWHVLGSPYLSGVEQVVLVQGVFFALIVAMVFTRLGRWQAGMPFSLLLLPLLTILDHRAVVAMVKRYDKSEAIEKVREIDHWIQEGRQLTAKAMAWCPILPPMKEGDVYGYVQHLHLSAMLAGQQRTWPVVNAYIKFVPDAYVPFLYAPSDSTLADWLDQGSRDSAHVQVIDNIGLPYVGIEKHLLSTTSHDAVRCSGEDGMLRTSQGEGELAACFTFIRLGAGRVVLLASNGRFVAADIAEGDLGLRANAPIAGDHCVFTVFPNSDGSFILKADNGSFVERATSGSFYAKAGHAEQAVHFRTEPLPKGLQ